MFLHLVAILLASVLGERVDFSDFVDIDYTAEVLPYAKKQTKANDCWYACIQMLKSSAACGKVKPVESDGQRRSFLSAIVPFKFDVLGKPINFWTLEGSKILRQNGLEKDDGPVNLQDGGTMGYSVTDLQRELAAKGPLIVLGKAPLPLGEGHFELLVGIKEGMYKMLDPWDGTAKSFTEEQFLAWAKLNSYNNLWAIYWATSW
eukprot:CAMPEP_0197659048 /NCGR_PEP_ID=MMETSP1338-20131121/46007_1 /TAXON_ID=43686 ORGANISM="Pelagodinium beii, Strain RCC1491" /NCGR_SAMPLE_ID=MMETSP1338 /ASSEMBLY_ACC=CAM_ASM_000754 /LENGTH=203 /DNA_ID=CAMNT_0043235793 /DNA_START=112 /DNA_END=720 /DNA_ORIENTATION=+